MIKSIVQNILKLVVVRVIVVLIATITVLAIFVDVKKALTNTNLAVLNRLRPDKYDDLIKIAQTDFTAKVGGIDQYRLYYQKVVEVMPTLADAKGLYAYSLYYSGSQSEAINVYEKALKINPTFFWFYYNLGVIHYQKADYFKAQSYFEQALNQKPQAALYFIINSQRLYLPVLLTQSSPENMQDFLKKQLTQGYQNAYKLRNDCANRQKNISSSTLDPALKEISLAVY